MRRGFIRSLLLAAAVCAAGSGTAAAHDLMASTCTVRVAGDQVELKIKVAADALWPVVQDALAPGAVLVMEDFERVAKPLLTAFGGTMEELTTADGAVLAPQSVSAAVVEDNFVFTLLYARPTAGVLKLKETYLARMPPGYISRIVVVDARGQSHLQQTLSSPNITAEIALTASGHSSPSK